MEVHCFLHLISIFALFYLPHCNTSGNSCVPDGSEKGLRKVGWRCSEKCIPRHYVCDGFVDCAGGEDEEESACVEPCPAAWLKCGYGNCLQPTQLCDGSAHCPGREDETAIACAWRQYLRTGQCTQCRNSWYNGIRMADNVWMCANVYQAKKLSFQNSKSS